MHFDVLLNDISFYALFTLKDTDTDNIGLMEMYWSGIHTDGHRYLTRITALQGVRVRVLQCE